MKISRLPSQSRRTGYEVRLSEYDGIPPSKVLFTDGLPATIDADREAIALYLIFRSWCGGEFSVVDGMSPHTASTIARDAFPVELQPQPIQFSPKALPRGRNTIHLNSNPSAISEDHTITVLPNHTWSGYLRSPRSFAVGTNAFAFQRDSSDYAPLIGIAVLYSEFLNVDKITVPSEIDRSLLRRVSALLSSVNLEIQFKF